MKDDKNLFREENTAGDFEKAKLYNLLIFEFVKTVPWDLDVKTMKIENIFGMDLFFSSGINRIDYYNWLEIIHPEDRDKVVPYLNLILEGKMNKVKIEYRIKNSSGDYIWIKTIADIIQIDDSGKPLLIGGVNREITAKKFSEKVDLQINKKISDSDIKLKNVMKIGRMSQWEYDFKTGLVISGRDMAETWGLAEYYDRGEPVKLEIFARSIHPQDREMVIEKFRNSLKNNESFELSFRLAVGGGVRFIHFVSEVVFDETGNPIKFAGITQDITNLKSLEDLLAQQYEGLRFIAKKAGLGLWEFNARDSFIFTINGEEKNSEPGDLYKKIKSSEFMKSIHPEDFDMFQAKLNFHMDKGGDVSDFDIRINTGKDIYRWYHITAVIGEVDGNGKPLIYKGLYQDITERKEIEGRLYQSQKMEAIGRLAGGIAHDFNNILQVILGYGSLALMDAGSDSDMLENISHIVDSGEKAKSLVRQLLIFARKEKFRPGLVSLNDLASGFITMLKRVIGENITLTFTPDKEIDFIHGDSGQIEQIFMNLCINSRDAINGSGSIIIKTKKVSTDEYWPCFDNRMPPGEYVMLSISDTGAGISTEYLEHIFEPFFTTKDKNSGTGLGLATVYSIVKQHGGYIDVHSLPEKGTTFSMYFPILGDKQNDAINYETEPVINRQAGNNFVLLAEDNELIRKYTRRILEDSGYNVILAEDGEMAVELFRANSDKIDLLLFDVVMPKKNGWDVYKEIGGVDNRIPVIFFSGYDQNLLPPDLPDSVPMLYVQKPFKYYTMINAIHELLDRKK